MGSFLPPVRATLHERYLFNFRMPAAVFQQFVPVAWLQPHLINQWAIISFCTLQLRHITVAPLPTVLGLSSISCAYRYAVLDASQPTPTPAVFVPARYTNNRFGSWFTHQGFSAPHPLVRATIVSEAEDVALTVTLPDDTPLFSATVRPAQACTSAVFADAEAFATFIRQGVTSYGTSVYAAQLTRIDLQKTETVFEPLDVVAWQDAMLHAWGDQGVTLDSAFRTAGGQYQWTYDGLIPTEDRWPCRHQVAS